MTKDEVKTYIQEALENAETSFVNNIDIFIRMAEKEIYSKVPGFRSSFSTAGTDQLTASQSTLSISGLTAESINSVQITTTVSATGAWRSLQLRDRLFIRECYPTVGDEDIPIYYSVDDSDEDDDDDDAITILLGPTPDAQYYYSVSYFGYPDSLADDAGDGDTWLSRSNPMTLIYGAMYHGYVYEKGEPDIMNEYKTKFASGISDLLRIWTEGEATDDYQEDS